MSFSRRDFGRLIAGASASALLTQIGGTAAMADTSGYRAMVGVFLFGGNDAWNMVVPTDSRYATYASQRGSVALPLSSLVPLTGSAFGLHPSFAPLKTAWDEGALSAVLNTGTLYQPLTKSLYQNNPQMRPMDLMSHEDQQNQWQGMRVRERNIDGFMGRILDKAAAADLPPLISIAGSQMALIGAQKSPLILPSTGSVMRYGYTPNASDAAVKARQAALDTFSDASAFGVVTDLTSRGMSSSYAQATAANAVVSATNSLVDAHFVNPTTGLALTSEISRQLMRAARMIEAHGTLGHDKQTFFVSQGGYDTHVGQTDADATKGTHANLYNDLALALAAFYKAMKALGLSDNVTAFTMSDFGRVFKANSQRGTDHAWGSNHLVLGGAVASRKIHGRYPDMTFNGPEDAGTDGRWIPSIAVEEYVGAIAQWYGVAATDLPYIFPNWSTWSTGGRGPVPLFG